MLFLANAVLSADGRYVAVATDLPMTPADTNRQPDVYRYDDVTRRVRLLTRTSGGRVLPHGMCPAARPKFVAMSRNGRYVAYSASATGIVYGDRFRAPHGSPQVYVWDGATGRTQVASRNNAGHLADRPARVDGVTDGGAVTFESAATNVPGHVPGLDRAEIYVSRR